MSTHDVETVETMLEVMDLASKYGLSVQVSYPALAPGRIYVNKGEDVIFYTDNMKELSGFIKGFAAVLAVQEEKITKELLLVRCDSGYGSSMFAILSKKEGVWTIAYFSWIYKEENSVKVYYNMNTGSKGSPEFSWSYKGHDTLHSVSGITDSDVILEGVKYLIEHTPKGQFPNGCSVCFDPNKIVTHTGILDI